MAEPTLASNNPFRRRAAATTPATGQTAGAAASDSLPPPFSSAEPESAQSPSQSQTPSPFEATASPFTAQPTGNEFRQQLRALAESSEAAPSTTFRNPKPIKRVRVQSPPPSPSSSEDEDAADFEARFPASGPPDPTEDSESSDDDEIDREQRSRNTPQNISGPSMVAEPETIDQETRPRAPPQNPFQKTLKDLEQEPDKAKEDDPSRPPAVPAPASKGSLDVSSFGRLLLTGQAGNAGAASVGSPNAAVSSPGLQVPPAASTVATGDAGSITDASSISRHSILDPTQLAQDTPRTSHEISEAEEERSSLMHMSGPSKRTTLRKKPPPPSSRHGKLIKPQPKDEAAQERRIAENDLSKTATNPTISVPTSKYATSPPADTPSSPSTDLNKPLPAPPAGRSPMDESESIFDREAAGKIPEVDIDPDAPDEDIPAPRPPTPPNASHSTTTTPSNPRKPAPPPRRQLHARAESKVSNTQHQQPQAQAGADDDGTPPRSSLDSTRSQSSIRVNISAPAPPPPRRGNHNARPSISSFASPSALSPAALGTTSPSSAGALSTATSPGGFSDAERSPIGLTQAAAMGDVLADNTGALPVSTAPQTKLSPPPPPPARHSSVRSGKGREGRPPSISSVDGVPASRRIRSDGASHSSGQLPPPPPPTRRRGGSGSGAGKQPVAVDKTKLGDTEAVAEEAETADVAGEGGGEGILADLDQLRREVEELRGKFGNGA